MGHWRGLAALTLLVLLVAAAARAQQTPAPIDPNDAYFARALARTNALPQPPSFTYTARVQTDGGTVEMQHANPEDVHVFFTLGGSDATTGARDATFTFAFNDRERMTYLVGGSDILGRFPGPAFDPTWNSVFRWMQGRRFFNVGIAPATPTPGPVPTGFKTIAIVSGAPALSYHVVGASRAMCANNDPGWKLSVVPVSDPDTHPLVGVIVDDLSGLLCAAAFEEPTWSNTGKGHIAVELRFDRVEGLYVATAESLLMRITGIEPNRSMSAEVSFGQFNIP